MKKSDHAPDHTSPAKPPHHGHHPKLSSFKAFDIVPPHKVRPNATSRPVITSAQPKHNDNTLVEPPHGYADGTATIGAHKHPLQEHAAHSSEKTEKVFLSHQHGLLQPSAGFDANESPLPSPLQPSILPVEPAETTDLSPPDQVQPGKTIPVPPSETPPPVAEERPGDEPEDVMAALQAQTEPTVPVIHDEQFNEALQEIDKQVKNKNGETSQEHYVVSIHQHDWLRTIALWLLWVILCAVVAVFIVDLLLDAGILHSTVHPFTNFFKN